MSEVIPVPAEILASLTLEERAALYLLPEVVGGKVLPEEVQQRLQDLGLVSAPLATGKRGLTALGSLVKRAAR